MTPAELGAWADATYPSRTQARQALGVSHARFYRYLAGEVAIPRMLVLACAWLSRERAPAASAMPSILTLQEMIGAAANEGGNP